MVIALGNRIIRYLMPFFFLAKIEKLINFTFSHIKTLLKKFNKHDSSSYMGGLYANSISITHVLLQISLGSVVCMTQLSFRLMRLTFHHGEFNSKLSYLVMVSTNTSIMSTNHSKKMMEVRIFYLIQNICNDDVKKLSSYQL